MKIRLILAIALPFAFIACQKATEDSAPGTCLIKRITSTSSDGYKTTGEMEYDSLHKPVKVSFYEDSIPDPLEMLLYNKFGVIHKEHEPGTDGSLDDVTSFAYTDGLIKSGLYSKSYEANGYVYTSKSVFSYEYNDQGYLISSSKVDSRTSTEPGFEPKRYVSTGTYTYEDGNLVNYLYEDKDNGYTYTVKYEYYKDLPSNQFTQYDRGDDANIALFAKISKNLVKKATKIFTSESWEQNFTYTFNEDGMVSSRKIVGKGDQSEPDNNIWVVTYEYACK